MRAFVFPGQGSQYVGMGVELAHIFQSARYVFQEIDDVLSFNLFDLMSSGSASELQLTINAQPALYAVSAAVLKVLQADFNFNIYDQVQFLAGHSLGEYSAYYAGQSLRLSDTALILRERGKLMQTAVPTGMGGMIALIGATFEQAEQLTQTVTHQNNVCEIANDNAPGQIIISGHLSALERLKIDAQSMGIKRIIDLPVSAPFHCSLMKNAADHMMRYLDLYDFRESRIPILSNVTAQPVLSKDMIKPLLIEQITGRVRWRETIENLNQFGVKEIIEIGAGKVLSGLVKRIKPDMNAVSIETPLSIEEWIRTLN